jgi:DNA-binding response OmpR family regulator
MKILLVEDERTIAVTLGHDLADAGHEVVHTPDGRHALRLLGEQAFDCVITDLRLPGADGMQVVRAARRARPSAEVIVITGHAAQDCERAALDSGASSVIEKPFFNDQILANLGRRRPPRDPDHPWTRLDPAGAA